MHARRLSLGVWSKASLGAVGAAATLVLLLMFGAPDPSGGCGGTVDVNKSADGHSTVMDVAPFELGVNMHVVWDAAWLPRLSDFGANWIRLDFSWGDFEPNEEVLGDPDGNGIWPDYRADFFDYGKNSNIQMYDNEIKAASAAGIRVLAAIGDPPAWAKESGQKRLRADKVNNWRRFLQKIAARYIYHPPALDQPCNSATLICDRDATQQCQDTTGRVLVPGRDSCGPLGCFCAQPSFGNLTYFEIYNEPNLFTDEDPGSYVNNIAVPARDALKKVSPNIQVLGPDLAQVGRHYEDFLRALPPGLFDIITLHVYTDNADTLDDWMWSDYRPFPCRAVGCGICGKCRDAMIPLAELSHPDAPVWVTEINSNDSPKNGTELAHMIKELRYPRQPSHAGKVTNAMIYEFSGSEFGLYEDNGNPTQLLRDFMKAYYGIQGKLVQAGEIGDYNAGDRCVTDLFALNSGNQANAFARLPDGQFSCWTTAMFAFLSPSTLGDICYDVAPWNNYIYTRKPYFDGDKFIFYGGCENVRVVQDNDKGNYDRGDRCARGLTPYNRGLAADGYAVLTGGEFSCSASASAICANPPFNLLHPYINVSSAYVATDGSCIDYGCGDCVAAGTCGFTETGNLDSANIDGACALHVFGWAWSQYGLPSATLGTIRVTSGSQVEQRLFMAGNCARPDVPASVACLRGLPHLGFDYTFTDISPVAAVADVALVVNSRVINTLAVDVPAACRSASRLALQWSVYLPIAGQYCVNVSDDAIAGQADSGVSRHDVWADNYLCANQDVGLAFSMAGPIPGKSCTNIFDPEAPASDTWIDNWICTSTDLGLRFSAAGPLPGMICTLVNEPSDVVGGVNWSSNNYLCLP